MLAEQMKKETSVENPANDPFAGLTGRTLKFVPLYLLVPVLYGVLFRAAGIPLQWKVFGLGALGWLAALFLRGPLAALVRGLPQERAKLIVGGSSGVLEEGVRLALLSLLAASFPQALSLGQGWAAIEVLFVIVNTLVILSLVKRTDEKAMQAKEILQAQGNLQASPLWGILERIWASAFHIGAALIIAHTPWTAALMIPLHSGFNLGAVRLAKAAPLPVVSLYAAAFGLLTLAAGLLLW
ncbi:YhfC family intramembrane metalloprotease [Paenibacillus sabinae]|uniref:YhfC family intramembrane metalloprotease n=1 Tax=Paenibacillus sabinae T27 TaxID=1268072 RepID=X4Z5Z4_9BACL|nr:YhfC family intramembrane metalloprotease [Paenibacillus sabinae]AHV95196.1 hypothetical protein PSAB_01290 [Paenibacillus sabinae T27]